MNKKKLIVLVSTILVVAILVVVGIFALSGDEESRIADKLDMGEKYLEELEYEKALAMYEAVLDIDPKNVEAYLGMAEVYIAMDDFKEALDILEEGYEETEAEELLDKMEEVYFMQKASSDEEVLALYPEFSRFVSEYIHHYPGLNYSRDDVDYEMLLGFAYSYFYYNDPWSINIDDSFEGVSIAAADVNLCVSEFFGIEIPLKNHGEVEYREDAFYFTREYFTNGGNYLAVIKKVVFEEDRYYITFQDVYVRWDGNVNGSLEDYYSLDYGTIKDDSCCDVNKEGTCILEKINDEWVIIKLTLERDKKAVAESRAGILEWDGHYYAMYDNVPSWSEDVALCESQGGHMATISSQEENDAIYEFISGMGYVSAYFGYSDDIEEGNWYWIGEKDNDYSNWHLPGEPNNEGAGENYGMFYYKYPDGTWNDGDFGGSTVNGGTVYICEWDTKKDMKAE